MLDQTSPRYSTASPPCTTPLRRLMTSSTRLTTSNARLVRQSRKVSNAPAALSTNSLRSIQLMHGQNKKKACSSRFCVKSSTLRRESTSIWKRIELSMLVVTFPLRWPQRWLTLMNAQNPMCPNLTSASPIRLHP